MTAIPDYVALEMRMAELMAQQKQADSALIWTRLHVSAPNSSKSSIN